jgi:2-methylcitrate dehydratase PrpD
MQFDASEMTNALGIAGSLSGGLSNSRIPNTGAMVASSPEGRPSGVLAASLASEKFTDTTRFWRARRDICARSATTRSTG